MTTHMMPKKAAIPEVNLLIRVFIKGMIKIVLLRLRVLATYNYYYAPSDYMLDLSW